MDTATILKAAMVLYLPLALCAPHHDVPMPMLDSPSPFTACQEEAECRCRMLETLVSRELSPSHCELLAAALATLVTWADQLQVSWAEQLAQMSPPTLLVDPYPIYPGYLPRNPKTPETTPGYETSPDNVTTPYFETTSRSTTNVETTSEGATDNGTKDNKVATTEKQDEGSSGKGRSGIILSPEYNKYPEYDKDLDTSTLIQVKYVLSSLTSSYYLLDQVEDGSRIELTFQVFDIEYSEKCSYDYVQGNG